MFEIYTISLRWRHNGLDGVSNHQPHHCLLNRLSKKTSKLRVTGLCVFTGTGEFPAQMTSNADNVSIWWRHHVLCLQIIFKRVFWYMRNISYRFIRMKFINMLSVYVQSGTHRRFNWWIIAVLTQNPSVLISVEITDAPKFYRKCVETWVFVAVSGQWLLGKNIRGSSYSVLVKMIH